MQPPQAEASSPAAAIQLESKGDDELFTITLSRVQPEDESVLHEGWCLS